MAPADIVIILERIAEVSSDLGLLATKVDHIDKTLRGGNGDKVGVYERVRSLLQWRGDHERAHTEQNVERRRKSDNLKGFAAELGKDVAKLVVSALIAFALWKSTGSIPSGIFN